MKKSTLIAATLILGSVISMSLMRNAKAQEMQPPQIKLPPGYEELGEKDWDDNRLEAARQGILRDYEVAKKIDQETLKGLDMIETPQNKAEVDALRKTLENKAEIAAEASKASVDLSFLEANNMDTTEAQQRYQTFVTDINQRNVSYGESMRTLGQPLDELVAKGQLDMPAYNPEFVEQYRQEQGIQIEPSQEQSQQAEQAQQMDQGQQDQGMYQGQQMDQGQQDQGMNRGQQN